MFEIPSSFTDISVSNMKIILQLSNKSLFVFICLQVSMLFVNFLGKSDLYFSALLFISDSLSLYSRTFFQLFNSMKQKCLFE